MTLGKVLENLYTEAVSQADIPLSLAVFHKHNMAFCQFPCQVTAMCISKIKTAFKVNKYMAVIVQVKDLLKVLNKKRWTHRYKFLYSCYLHHTVWKCWYIYVSVLEELGNIFESVLDVLGKDTRLYNLLINKYQYEIHNISWSDILQNKTFKVVPIP